MDFFKFLFHPSNRKVLVYVALFHILVAAIFNWAYPFTIYTYDTANYFLSADVKEFGGYRPYGYSAFINFCMFFSQSVYSIVFIQSLFFLLASIFFIFTVAYIAPFKNKKHFYIFCALVCFSGNAFFLNNALISDSLFLSLTLVWISSFFHILNSKKINYPLFIFNLIICFWAAKVRYAGLVYPVIGAVTALVLYRKQILNLFIHAAAFTALFFLIYSQGVKQNVEKYGIEIFSAFGGWAKLNNASVVIPKMPKDIRDPNLYRLHALFTSYPDSLYSTQRVFTGNLMWDKKYPEKIYMKYILSKHKDKGFVPCYVYCGKLYSDYANYLIKNQFSTFIGKFYLPNLGRVIYPGTDDINGNVHAKIDPSTKKVSKADFQYFVSRKDIYGKYFSSWSGLKYLLLALTFFSTLGYYLFKKTARLDETQRKMLNFIVCFFVINSLFLAYTHPVLHRYVLIHEFLFIASSLILINFMYQSKTVEVTAKK